jgi:hypothetical protein
VIFKKIEICKPVHLSGPRREAALRARNWLVSAGRGERGGEKGHRIGAPSIVPVQLPVKAIPKT